MSVNPKLEGGGKGGHLLQFTRPVPDTGRL